MGTGHKFGHPVEDGSGLRLVRRWRLLLAHDATASTCDYLIDAIEGALGNVDVNESTSVDDARVALDNFTLREHPPHDGGGGPRSSRFDLCMVCLDLPPAPLAGVRLAQDVIRQGVPLVLITRSMRWVPASAVALRDVPWVPPDATAAQVSRAVGEAMAMGPRLVALAPELRARLSGGE
jgi:hypothetical protein